MRDKISELSIDVCPNSRHLERTGFAFAKLIRRVSCIVRFILNWKLERQMCDMAVFLLQYNLARQVNNAKETLFERVLYCNLARRVSIIIQYC